jgi:hypothetical protein
MVPDNSADLIEGIVAMLEKISRIAVGPVVVLMGLGLYRLSAGSSTPEVDPLVQVSRAPTPIEPRYDWPQVATDEQISQVLDRVKPPPAPFNTNNMVHALRLWGQQARFDDPAIPSGAQMRDYFIDDRVFQQLAPAGAPPIFAVQADGEVRVRSWERDNKFVTTSSYHTADLLATMGEIGLPSDTPLITRNGTATVGDLLRSSMRRYHAHQFEYEWSTISYARYLFPVESFENKFGERFTTQQIMAELVNLPANLGACNGTHRIEALVVLNRADDAVGGLSPREKQFALQRMAQLSSILAASQSPDGYWTRQWSRGAKAQQDQLHDLYEGILVTGHHLEWLALAPEEVLPPRETIVRASQWLVRAMLEEDAENLYRHYGPCTHAARALCLWRDRDPYEFWREMHDR